MYLWILSACLSVAQPTFIYNPGYPILNGGIVTNGIPPPIVVPTTITPTVFPTFPPLTPVPTGPFPSIDPRISNSIVFSGSGSIRSKGSLRKKRQTNCGCHPITQCPTTPTHPNTDGSGLIDFRVVSLTNVTSQDCMSGFKFCCLSTSGAQQSCGSRIQTTITYPTTSGQARYGDYPWMAGLLANDNAYVGGGVLIDTQHVLSTAHRITNYPNGNGLKVRLGEWDYSGTYEQYPYRDSPISRVWIHESYNPSTLQNDVALIRMTTALPAGTLGIVPICLPTTGQIFDGQRCWVAGWGKDSFTSTTVPQTVLKAVDVPVLAPASCETTLRTTRLGAAYVLDRAAFICAGGELSKDACTGDGGSGLVCETTPGRWTLAGLVAWGLGCATQGVPAAYVNVVNYLPWITPKQATP